MKPDTPMKFLVIGAQSILVGGGLFSLNAMDMLVFGKKGHRFDVL